MRIVCLTNDNFFCFTFIEKLLKQREDDIKLIVFSSTLIGKRGIFASIKWALIDTGFRHTIFKLMVYGVFRFMKIVCTFLPFIPNRYSFHLWAKRSNTNYFFTSNINDEEVVQQIRAANPELIVAANMNQIIKRPILDISPNGIINTHAAALPRYAGMSPYLWALANNEVHSAITIHYMEEGLDEGDIIVQEKVDIMKDDSAFSLFYRCCLLARDLLPKVVDEIEAGTVTSYKQDLSQKTCFSWPTKECVRNLHKNGYRLARITDFINAIFRQKPRIG